MKKRLRESLEMTSLPSAIMASTPVRQQSISLARNAAMSPQQDARRRQQPAPSPLSATGHRPSAPAYFRPTRPAACCPICCTSLQARPGSRSRLEQAASKARPPVAGLAPTTQFSLTTLSPLLSSDSPGRLGLYPQHHPQLICLAALSMVLSPLRCPVLLGTPSATS
jgi:hypothetical protein